VTESTIESTIEVVVDSTEEVLVRVLHVDDEAGFLKVAKQCLEMHGAFQIETASSVDEALKKMKKKEFDVIVSDYQMPEKDGLEFLKELRGKGNTVSFIMFTGRGREEIAIRALNLGADQYLNKTGDPEAVYGELAYAIRKIVKAKHDEERVRRSEEKYRSLFESSKDVTLTLDLKGNITSINKAAVGYGLKKDEVIGENIRKFAPKRYWPRLFRDLVQLARGKPVKGNIEMVTPQGKKTAEYNSNPIIINNRVVGVQSILKDVTERRKAEEELKSSEERLKILFEFAPDAYYLNDLKGNFVDGNKAAEDLTGYSRSELVGKSFLKLKLLRRKQVMKATALLVKNALGKPTGPDEFVLNRKDGTPISVEIRTFPIKIKNQTLVLGIARDISERKRIEAALKTMNEKLRVVGGLTQHDVRNKLSTMLGRIYLVKEKLSDYHEALVDLDEVQSAIGEAERILDFARIYETLGIEDLTDVNVSDKIKEAISLRPEVQSALQGVKIVDETKGLTVLADSLVRHLFYNLIHNSIMHGQNVGQITIRYSQGNEGLKLICEDNGVGINKVEKEKIFEKGYGKGTGFGLYLIRKICEVYGWTIKETGKARKGAQFTMTIPRLNESGRENYRLP